MTEGGGSKKVSKKIGFIGAGQMAEALARGFHSRGVAPASNMYAYDPAPVRRDVFKSFGAHPAETSSDVSLLVLHAALWPSWASKAEEIVCLLRS